MVATIRGVPGQHATELQRLAQDRSGVLQEAAQRLYEAASEGYAEAARHRQLAQQLWTRAQSQHRLRAWFTRSRMQRAIQDEAKATQHAHELARQRASVLETVQRHHTSEQQAAAGVRAEQRVVSAVHGVPGVSEILCGLSFGPALGDIDVIALGRRVVVLEVKAGTGKISMSKTGTLYHGSKAVPRNPVKQCAKQVHLLREAGAPTPQGLVVFPDALPERLLIAGTGVMVVGGLDALCQELQRIMQSSPSGPVIHAVPLVQSVDRWLVNQHATMRQRLQTAYQHQHKRETLLHRWHAEYDRIEGSDHRAWHRREALDTKISRVSVEHATESKNIGRLTDTMGRWEEARRDNRRLVT